MLNPWECKSNRNIPYSEIWESEQLGGIASYSRKSAALSTALFPRMIWKSALASPFV